MGRTACTGVHFTLLLYMYILLLIEHNWDVLTWKLPSVRFYKSCVFQYNHIRRASLVALLSRTSTHNRVSNDCRKFTIRVKDLCATKWRLCSPVWQDVEYRCDTIATVTSATHTKVYYIFVTGFELILHMVCTHELQIKLHKGDQ
jgi:hypothetical protein